MAVEVGDHVKVGVAVGTEVVGVPWAGKHWLKSEGVHRARLNTYKYIRRIDVQSFK